MDQFDPVCWFVFLVRRDMEESDAGERYRYPVYCRVMRYLRKLQKARNKK